MQRESQARLENWITACRTVWAFCRIVTTPGASYLGHPSSYNQKTKWIWKPLLYSFRIRGRSSRSTGGFIFETLFILAFSKTGTSELNTVHCQKKELAVHGSVCISRTTLIEIQWREKQNFRRLRCTNGRQHAVKVRHLGANSYCTAHWTIVPLYANVWHPFNISYRKIDVLRRSYAYAWLTWAESKELCLRQNSILCMARPKVSCFPWVCEWVIQITKDTSRCRAKWKWSQTMSGRRPPLPV